MKTNNNKNIIEFNDIEGNSILCGCGNEDSMDGFETCDKDGNIIEPTIDSKWEGHYICLRCGQIFKDITDYSKVGGFHNGK